MKKILVTFLILNCALQAYGFEDYIIMSDKSVQNVYSKNENILSILPFFTIDNKKNTMIVKTKSEGNTQIVIETLEGTIDINVDVSEKEAVFSELDGISIFPLDFLDKPIIPELREGK